MPRNPQHTTKDLSRGAFYSIFLFITGAALIVFSIVRDSKKQNPPTPAHP